MIYNTLVPQIKFFVVFLRKVLKLGLILVSRGKMTICNHLNWQ